MTAINEPQREGDADLVAAFPIGDDRIRLVFSGWLDPSTCRRPERYASSVGLPILEVDVSEEHDDHGAARASRVTLKTEPMSGHSLVVDTISLDDVRGRSGKPLGRQESRPFIHGIASIPGIQWPASDGFPFTSRFEGLVATASCQKDGGVNSNKLIDVFGWCFLHVERGGPFNSIKVATNKHVPGIDDEVKRLSPRGLSPHVLWSGGEIRTVDGETRLVDTGFMEGSILDATPKHYPPPFRVKTSDLAGDEARSLRSRSLQGVIVRFENVTIDRVWAANEQGERISAPQLRSFIFHDDSGAELVAVMLDSVGRELRAGEAFDSLRALVHQPKSGQYEGIIELDDHFNYPLGKPDGLRQSEDFHVGKA
jgi:hypothetical protein